MVKRMCLLLVAGLFLLLPPVTARATYTTPPSSTPRQSEQAAPSDPAYALEQVERARMSAMNRVATAHDIPLPPLLPLDAGAAACPGNSVTRQVNVSSAATLVRALADARPGDQIRLVDGIYHGEFAATASGTLTLPITMCGTRQAVLEGSSLASGYGLHLQGSYWTLAGFTVRNVQKGIVLDGASHNLLHGLEVYQTGDEGIHFRAFSTDNRLNQSWVHHSGLRAATFGEGVYIGTAYSNWDTYSRGRPDRSDRNQVIGNVIGPNTKADNVDIKEGTTGGVIRDNVFFSAGMTAATAWVNVKGNSYTITGNAGLYLPATGFKQGFEVHVVVAGWGANNEIHDNVEQAAQNKLDTTPFRASQGKAGPVSIVLPPRALPYSLTELLAYFPASIASEGSGVFLIKEHILVAHGARLTITEREAHELRLLSTPARFVSIVAWRSGLAITGSDMAHVTITSWDPATNGPDRTPADGRAYLLTRGGSMDLDRVAATDLGFGENEMSGVAWRGTDKESSQGSVTASSFQRNAVGALANHAAGMHWTHNVVADSLADGLVLYGTDNSVVEENEIYHNGKAGILCARGCTSNTLRRNSSYTNHEHGIVLSGAPDAKGGQPTASANNQLVQNHIWDNNVGIVLQGIAGNVVRSNDIHNNQYGMRLVDGASDNELADNSVQANAQIGIHIYNQASRNRVMRNIIRGAQLGVVIRAATATVLDDNVIASITGQGIVLDNTSSGTERSANQVDDSLSRAAIQAPAGVIEPPATREPTLAWSLDGVAGSRLARVHAHDDARRDTMSHTSALTPWHTLFDLVLQHPAVLLWIIVFSLPIAAWLLMRVNVGTSKLSVEADAPLRLEPRRRTRRPGRGR